MCPWGLILQRSPAPCSPGKAACTLQQKPGIGYSGCFRLTAASLDCQTEAHRGLQGDESSLLGQGLDKLTNFGAPTAKISIRQSLGLHVNSILLSAVNPTAPIHRLLLGVTLQPGRFGCAPRILCVFCGAKNGGAGFCQTSFQQIFLKITRLADGTLAMVRLWFLMTSCKMIVYCQLHYLGFQELSLHQLVPKGAAPLSSSAILLAGSEISLAGRSLTVGRASFPESVA
jgi:hypothetical protein